MLNKIEKHRIENIINNLDENDGIENILEELRNQKKCSENLNNTNITLNDSGICNQSSLLLDTSATDDHIFDDSINEESESHENTLNLTVNEEHLNKSHLENINDAPNTDSSEISKENTENITINELLDASTIEKPIQNSEISIENLNVNELLEETASDFPTNDSTIEKQLENCGISEENTQNLTVNDLPTETNSDIPTNNNTIETFEDSSNITNTFDAKVATLKQVQIRLKRLTHEELCENSSEYRNNYKKQKMNPMEVKNNYYDREMLCGDCTGCTAIKHFNNLKNISSDVEKKVC